MKIRYNVRFSQFVLVNKIYLWYIHKKYNYYKYQKYICNNNFILPFREISRNLNIFVLMKQRKSYMALEVVNQIFFSTFD